MPGLSKAWAPYSCRFPDINKFKLYQRENHQYKEKNIGRRRRVSDTSPTDSPFEYKEDGGEGRIEGTSRSHYEYFDEYLERSYGVKHYNKSKRRF